MSAKWANLKRALLVAAAVAAALVVSEGGVDTTSPEASLDGLGDAAVERAIELLEAVTGAQGST